VAGASAIVSTSNLATFRSPLELAVLTMRVPRVDPAADIGRALARERARRHGHALRTACRNDADAKDRRLLGDAKHVEQAINLLNEAAECGDAVQAAIRQPHADVKRLRRRTLYALFADLTVPSQ
jgi:hypothetical protein